jgi:hypothetical protein
MQPGLDTLTIYPGVLSSYPNFMFNMCRPMMCPRLLSRTMEAEPGTQAAFERIVQRWGIRRSHPQFWEYFHDIWRIH